MKLRLQSLRFGALPVVAGTLVLLAASPSPEVKPGAVTDHVVVISIDGLRPDAIEQYGAGTLQRLQREGSFSAQARTIFPSKTLPSHTSMLTGVTPEVHGITWNNDRTKLEGVVKVETVFEAAKNAGYTTAAFFSKSKFRHLMKPGTLDYAQAPRGVDTWMATRTVVDAINYLHHRRPNLLFVHIGEPDYAGHSIGWMSAPYGWAVKRADGAVNSLLKAADKAFGAGNYTVIVTADHGGHDRDHGTDDVRDMTIPWMAWGKGVNGQTQLNSISTTHTASTVLMFLGVAAPSSWGEGVAGAFTPSALAASQAAVAAQ